MGVELALICGHDAAPFGAPVFAIRVWSRGDASRAL
jgi:hypothetical protein